MPDMAIAGAGAKLTQDQQDKFNEEAFKSYNETALDRCPNCNRTFLPDRLVVHLRSCKTPKEPRSKSP